MPANELEDLQQLVISLTERVESMQDELDRRDTRAESGADAAIQPAIEIPEAVSRRRWMKAAAAAAVGGTAVALSQSQPAAAASTMDIGTYNGDAVRTVGDHTGVGSAGVSFLFKTRMAATGETSDFPAALSGWSGSDVRLHGVHGLSAQTAGEGIGVVGESKSDRGTGVFGSGWYGVVGTGTDYGVAGTGSKGSLLVNTSGFVPPTAVPVEALPGALYGETTDAFSNTGSVWCAVSKSGEWRKLAGFDTAGSLHTIAPVRIYDSRVPVPLPAKLAPGSDRTLSVANGRDLITGDATLVDVVPEGARAIAYNITVDRTEANGFLSVNPGGTVALGASTINWSAGGATLANGGIVGLDGSRRIKVFCGGNGPTDFIVDVTGYYL